MVILRFYLSKGGEMLVRPRTSPRTRDFGLFWAILRLFQGFRAWIWAILGYFEPISRVPGMDLGYSEPISAYSGPGFELF